MTPCRLGAQMSLGYHVGDLSTDGEDKAQDLGLESLPGFLTRLCNSRATTQTGPQSLPPPPLLLKHVTKNSCFPRDTRWPPDTLAYPGFSSMCSSTQVLRAKSP